MKKTKKGGMYGYAIRPESKNPRDDYRERQNRASFIENNISSGNFNFDLKQNENIITKLNTPTESPSLYDLKNKLSNFNIYDKY